MIPSAPLGTDAAVGLIGLGADGSPARAAATRRFRFELAAHPDSPAQARRLTRARLTGWSVCEDSCDTAALVISELVTNAIVHTASTHIVCELHDDGDDLVRIAVRDEGCAPGDPHPSARQRPEEEHGRGLLLIDALCHAWGAHEHGPGLLVWAELPRGADPADPRNDLGWGTRPKPGPPGGSVGEEAARAGARRQAQAPIPAPAPARTSPWSHAQPASRTPPASHTPPASRPQPWIRAQRQAHRHGTGAEWV
ncbi:ATP-binding protein [Streptomyces sp. TRM68367]|uniref:ATP-binding protein n=1 Tax=Streptomyces sp. TRM68367 TaxID=2758415 RepID=UPI00165B9CE9|nr:ATP-binding protein [Streptomyces sp. TRM68367]